MNEIVNKVAQSGLIEINLEDFLGSTSYCVVDLKLFLQAVKLPSGDEAFLLREKSFREQVEQLNIEEYKNKIVLLTCTVDALIPTWAFMLLSLKLSHIAQRVISGTPELLYQLLLFENIQKIDLEKFRDKRVIIKGCSKKEIPLNSYTQLCTLLKPYVKSIMFGEPCSTVPLYKKQAVK